MTAKPQQKQSIIKAADYVEGKSPGGVLPAIQKNVRSPEVVPLAGSSGAFGRPDMKSTAGTGDGI